MTMLRWSPKHRTLRCNHIIVQKCPMNCLQIARQKSADYHAHFRTVFGQSDHAEHIPLRTACHAVLICDKLTHVCRKHSRGLEKIKAVCEVTPDELLMNSRIKIRFINPTLFLSLILRQLCGLR